MINEEELLILPGRVGSRREEYNEFKLELDSMHFYSWTVIRSRLFAAHMYSEQHEPQYGFPFPLKKTSGKLLKGKQPRAGFLVLLTV